MLKANQELNIEINNELSNNNADSGVGIFTQVYSKVDLTGEIINIKNAKIGVLGIGGSIINTNGDSLNIASTINDSDAVVSRNESTVNINNKMTNISGKNTLYAYAGGKINFTEAGKHNITGEINVRDNHSIIDIRGDKGNIINSKISARDGGITNISVINGGLSGDVNDYNLGYVGREGIVRLDLSNGLWNNYNSSSVTEVKLTNGNIKFSDGTGIYIGFLNSAEKGAFYMKLDSEHLENGNMLYVQNSSGGEYNVNLVGSNLANFNIGDRIRFATIGKKAKDNNISFKVEDINERGVNDIVLETRQSSYITGEEENNIYNKFAANAIDEKFTDGENWYIERVKPNQMNDIALSIVTMSKSNYTNAVFMDNLNKRLGDMSFANGNSGIWVRMRNDRVGEDDQYRLYNYMTQIGYDKLYPMENGTEHRGIAFEYGRGDMKYKELNGSTDTDKYILTIYDTRLRNNGIYTDYTLRGGAVSNDFTVYGRETGTKATGKFKNMLLGVGFETGKRFEFDKNWYFEPQGQLQYTYINSTDYTTNQDTKVNLEEIHSLIGRVGIRVGHDLYKENSKDNTIYIKADINHEFLGEQNVKAADITGNVDKTYRNDETWYNIGIGTAKKVTPSFNVYMDVEKQFGRNKNNKSWQLNLGFRYKF